MSDAARKWLDGVAPYYDDKKPVSSGYSVGVRHVSRLLEQNERLEADRSALVALREEVEELREEVEELRVLGARSDDLVWDQTERDKDA